jgi:hypothetical protein
MKWTGAFTAKLDLRFSRGRLWRVLSSGIWRRVVRWKSSDVSQEHIFFIFRVDAELCLPLTFTLFPCSAHSSTLKMEAICPSKTSVDIQRAIQRYIPGDIQNFRVFGLCPSSTILKTRKQRFGNWIRFCLQVKGANTYSFGSLRKSPWLKLALSKGLNRVCVSL